MALLLTASPVTRLRRLHRDRVRAASPAFIWCPEFAHWRRLAQPLVGVEWNPSRRLPSLNQPYRWRGWSWAGEAERRAGTAEAGRGYGERKRSSVRTAGAASALGRRARLSPCQLPPARIQADRTCSPSAVRWRGNEPRALLVSSPAEKRLQPVLSHPLSEEKLSPTCLVCEP